MGRGAADEPSEPLPRPWDDPSSLLDVDEVRERILAAVRPLEPMVTPLPDALGLVLAENVVADVDLPIFSNSAMDGYALRAADTLGAAGAQPVTVRVAGEQSAGASSGIVVRPGEALRIMTGAPIPAGADAVVRLEETRVVGGQDGAGSVLIFRSLRAGENVRPAGEDLRQGEEALSAGTVLRAAEIGLLAALNRASVRVYPRPRVGVLSTGDEVRPLGTALRPGEIRDANGSLLAALVRECGGTPVSLGVAPDRPEELRARLRSVRDVDLLVTSGGVSVGDHDVLEDVVRGIGHVALCQVRIKPGKPMAFGTVGTTALLGLPGNPAAAAVAFLQFAWPALLKMLGRRDCSLPTARARLMTTLDNRGGRRQFVRGVLERRGDEFEVRPTDRRGAASLMSLARANVLIVLPEQSSCVEAGATVDVQLLPSSTSVI